MKTIKEQYIDGSYVPQILYQRAQPIEDRSASITTTYYFG